MDSSEKGSQREEDRGQRMGLVRSKGGDDQVKGAKLAHLAMFCCLNFSLKL